MKIGIIVGSIREGRNGIGVGEWVLEKAQSHGGAEFELVDLKSFNVPLLTTATVPGAAQKKYDSPEVTAWSQKIDELDGYIFVTPEYNHGVPGGFKNAFDSLGSEWSNKAVALIGYGADNGVRAVEQWRPILNNLNMYTIRAAINFNLFSEFGDAGFAPEERRNDEINALLDSIVSATEKMSK